MFIIDVKLTSDMKECEKLQIYGDESRKARIERQNLLIRGKMKISEASLPGSISLSSLSIKTEEEEDEDRGGCSLNIFSVRSKRPSDILHSFNKPDLSEKDRKILGLMAARRDAKIEEGELALYAKCTWEEDKIRREKGFKEKKESHAEYLIQKRQLEKVQNTMRKRYKDETLKQEKLLLEMKIAEDQEKAEKRHEVFHQKKMQMQKSISKNRTQIQRILKRQKEQDEETEKVRRVTMWKEKEKKSEEALAWISMERRRRIREERRKRELKWVTAKNQRDQLKRQCEEDLLNHINLRKIKEESQAEKLLSAREWKRRLASDKNNVKKQHHRFLLNRKIDEDAEKIDEVRQRIQDKNIKMRIFREKREMEVLKSKFNARTTANLRQMIQATYAL